MTFRINSQAEQFLLAVQRLQAHAGKTRSEISSGIRVSSASDAPGDVSAILGLQNMVARSVQSRSNITRYRAEVDSSELAISKAVELMERASVLAATGGSELPNVNRPLLAAQAEDLLRQMVALAGTNADGRFIFSGASDQQAPYVLDLQQPSGVLRQVTISPARQVEDAAGVTLPQPLTADSIFDTAGKGGANPSSIFAALNQLRLALAQDNVVEVRAAAEKLSSGAVHLNEKLAYYGNLQNRLEDAASLATKFELNWQQALSELRDTDIAAAAVDLTQTRTQLDATYGAQAQRPAVSLFDYLK